MTNPNLPYSNEGVQYIRDQVIIAADWDTRFTTYAAGMRAFSAEIESTDEPDKMLDLTEMKGEALVLALGSGVLSLLKRDIVTERESFEAEFGNR